MENNIYITGVGGQGAIRLGQIIANYTLEKGKRIKFYKEVGMAQRGGAVHCEIRIGDVYGSRIPPYSADVVVVMELAEGLKAVEFIKPGGTIILNKKKVYPIDIMTHPEKYPHEKEIEKLLQETKAKVIWVDAEKIATEIGLSVVENMVLLGALSFVSCFDKKFMLKILTKRIPRELEKNIAAFNTGYKVAKGMVI